MWRIAIKMLVADRGKLAVALIGIIFSVVLVNVQGGLFLGLIRKASLLIENGEADIWVGHRNMNNVDFPKPIPRRWGDRIRSIPGIDNTQAYLVGHSMITLPDGGYEMVVLIGTERGTQLGSAWNTIVSDDTLLSQPDSIIVDIFDRDKLGDPKLGDVREIGGKRAKVTAFCHGILGFLVTPYVFTTFDRATEYLEQPKDQCSYFLVKTDGTHHINQVQEEIKKRLPHADVLSKSQYAARSIKYWTTRTGIGISFGAATLLGLMVGMVMVGQTLYASVLDRLHEFGTLLAFGAQDRNVFQIIFYQAIALAIFGSLLGMCIVLLIQDWFSTPRAPIVIPWWLSSGACLCVTFICLTCSFIPFFQLHKLDPAAILQS